MNKLYIILLFSCILSISASGQKKPQQKPKTLPVEKMMLRGTTRDQILISHGNIQRIRLQNRKINSLKRNRQMIEHRMMNHRNQIHNRGLMHRKRQRQAVKRRMIQQKMNRPARQPIRRRG